jgi:hypothetical protein
VIEDGQRPVASRMSDYLLGNGHSLAIDRKLADELERAVPDIRLVVQLGRLFLRSAVTHMVRADVRQFVKFGSDLPTVGNAHTVAQAADGDCRVLYVDTDPIAVAHSRLSLAGDEQTAVVQADPDDPGALLALLEADQLIDLEEPVGLLLVDVLRFLPESWDPPDLIERCAKRFAPGSQVAIAHLNGQDRPAECAALIDVMRASRDPIQPRTYAEVVALFGGFELVGPGLTGVGQWYGERVLTDAEKAAATQFYVGIGRKPLPRKK